MMMLACCTHLIRLIKAYFVKSELLNALAGAIASCPSW